MSLVQRSVGRDRCVFCFELLTDLTMSGLTTNYQVPRISSIPNGRVEIRNQNGFCGRDV